MHGYRVVYYRDVGGVSGSSEVIATAVYTREVMGLVCNTAYRFEVSGRGDGSPYSRAWGPAAEESGTTAACPTAPAPVGLEVEASTPTSITLRWNLEDDVHAYRVQYRVAGTGGWTEFGGVSASEFIDTTIYTRKVTPLVCGTNYEFRVSARGDGSPYSRAWGAAAEVSGTPACVPPPPTLPLPPVVSNFDATGTSSGVSLSWTGMTGIQGYRIRALAGGSPAGPGSLAESASATATSYDFTFRCDQTQGWRFEISAQGDGVTYRNDFGPTVHKTASRDPCPEPTPTATPTPGKLEAPTGLKSRPRGSNKGYPYIEHDGKLVLYWDDVPGVAYEVQQKKVRAILWDQWKKLPFDDFTINGSSDENVSITDSSVLIGGLTFDKRYEHRVRVWRDGQSSEWATLETRLPPAFLGHQADHTAQYKIGTRVPSPTPGGPVFPDDIRTVIPASRATAIAEWNTSAAAAAAPYVFICPVGQCPTGRHDDGRTVIINVRHEFSRDSCGKASACVRPLATPTPFADADGYMNNLEMIIKEPFTRRHSGLPTVRWIWTHDPELHGAPIGGFTIAGSSVPMRAEYKYLPWVFMHEFGHVLGLTDLYWFEGKYPGSLMGLFPEDKTDLHTAIPTPDIDYLRQVYRNHTAHPPTPTPNP